MPSTKIGEWLRSHSPFVRTERDYLAGVVDGDIDRHPRARARKARKMRVNVLIEIERGKGNLLLTCDVTDREFARFVDAADEAVEGDPASVVYLHPEPENGVEQERLGIPLDRLIRIERDDGELLYAPGDRLGPIADE